MHCLTPALQRNVDALAMLQLIAQSEARVTTKRTFTTEEVFALAEARLKEHLDSRRHGCDGA